MLPSRLREWRRHPLRARRSGEWGRFKEALRAHRYDAVIDAQGLIKSAFVTRLAHGPKFGLDRISAREGLSARVLDHPLPVPRGGHAVTRVRTLFALALGYPLPDDDPDYGLVREHTPRPLTEPGAELVFCHGTTWPTKHYPEAYWRALAEKAAAAGHRVHLPWGNDAEHARAERLAGTWTASPCCRACRCRRSPTSCSTGTPSSPWTPAWPIWPPPLACPAWACTAPPTRVSPASGAPRPLPGGGVPLRALRPGEMHLPGQPGPGRGAALFLQPQAAPGLAAPDRGERAMKLAFLLFEYFPYGGLQRDMLAIAEAAEARGHQVTVFTRAWHAERPASPRVETLEVGARSITAATPPSWRR